MKRAFVASVIFTLLSVFLTTPFAFADEYQVKNTLFIPVANINDDGRIMDSNRWLLGRFDKTGTVLDALESHLGYVNRGDTILDMHYKVIAEVDEEGTITDPEGNVIGYIAETKITDAAGTILFRFEGPITETTGLLAYIFFFTDAFGEGVGIEGR